MEVKFSQEQLDKVKEIISRYPEGKQKSALLPLLHLAQEDFGWCSVEVMDYIATLLHIKPVEVYEVATFYSMFHMKPVGKYVLEVCQTGPCMLRGSDQIVNYLKKKLGVEMGGTSADGMFTLKTVECLASCGSAPMMQVEDAYYEYLSEEKIDEILDMFRANAIHRKEHFPGRTV